MAHIFPQPDPQQLPHIFPLNSILTLLMLSFLRESLSSWWLNQPVWKILVNLDHFPKDPGENNKIFETTT